MGTLYRLTAGLSASAPISLLTKGFAEGGSPATEQYVSADNLVDQ